MCSETALEARMARGGKKSPHLVVRPLLGWALGDWGEGGKACMKLRAGAASQYPWHVPERWAGSVCQCLAELAAVTPSRAHFIGAGRESGEPNVLAKDSEARDCGCMARVVRFSTHAALVTRCRQRRGRQSRRRSGGGRPSYKGASSGAQGQPALPTRLRLRISFYSSA